MRRINSVFGLLAAATLAFSADPVPSESTMTDRGPSSTPVIRDSALEATPPLTPPEPPAAPTPAPAPAAQAPDVPVPPPTAPIPSRMRGARPPMMPRSPEAMAPASAPGEAPVATPAAAAPEPDSVYDEDKALEIKLKSDPEAARRYRSPRKAFFFSLLLPGAGQVYTGSYVKAGLFAAAELGIGIGWYKVAVVGSREKANEARQWAAQHWRQQRYEDRWAKLFSDDTSGKTQVQQISSPQRSTYCASLYGDVESPNRTACSENPGSSDFKLHLAQFAQGGASSSAADAWSAQQVQDFRAANIKRSEEFEDLIGRYQEFLPGWEDNPDTTSFQALQWYVKSIQESEKDPSVVVVSPWGGSAMREKYLDLRQQADDLARTQKWFLGAMVANHIASAFDAALTANRMNRKLLQLETSWIDGLNVQGGLAWVGGLPATRGQVDWSF